MNAIIYIRNNTTSEKPTIEEQRNVCRRYAADQGINIVDEYISEVMLANRNNLDELIDNCKEKEISVILAFSDKLITDTAPNLALERVVLMQNHMSLICVNHTADPSVTILESMLMSFVEWLREEHSAKIKRGIQRAKERKAAQAAAEGKPVA